MTIQKNHKAKKSLELKNKFIFARAKKALGQNFLKSTLALHKIIEVGNLSKTDTVLEIGPGKGALTEQILACDCRVIAIEKDRELVEFLQNKFQKEITDKKLILVEDDCLNFKPKSYQLKPKTYKLIANIPYNITGAILKKFLTMSEEEGGQPERMVLMVQHEVAKRIVASDKKESILSISVKAYGEPKMIMKVPARYFSPPPKVDSAVISIKNISRNRFTSTTSPLGHSSLLKEGRFWEIVKTGFAHKRKQLAGNLKGVVKDEVLKNFEKKRAEDLSLEDWIHISTS